MRKSILFSAIVGVVATSLWLIRNSQPVGLPEQLLKAFEKSHSIEMVLPDLTSEHRYDKRQVDSDVVVEFLRAVEIQGLKEDGTFSIGWNTRFKADNGDSIALVCHPYDEQCTFISFKVAGKAFTAQPVFEYQVCKDLQQVIDSAEGHDRRQRP